MKDPASHEKGSCLEVKPDKQGGQAIYFSTPVEFGRWLKENHDISEEVWVGFYKSKSAGRGTTYSEALDAALCYGWIDAFKKKFQANRKAWEFFGRRPGLFQDAFARSPSQPRIFVRSARSAMYFSLIFRTGSSFL